MQDVEPNDDDDTDDVETAPRLGDHSLFSRGATAERPIGGDVLSLEERHAERASWCAPYTRPALAAAGLVLLRLTHPALVPSTRARLGLASTTNTPS